MFKYIIKILLCLIFFLGLGIFCKMDSNYKKIIKYSLYEDNISFSNFENIYNKYLGGVFPLEGMGGNSTQAVFNEELVVSSSIPYYDGAMLEVGYNYLVPSLKDGVIVFVGEKERYGNVVIIESNEGVKIWYGNVCNVNNVLYDHINKGDIVGESCDNYLYLLYNKDNKFLDYEELENW